MEPAGAARGTVQLMRADSAAKAPAAGRAADAPAGPGTPPDSRPKVAIVHDWLIGGGAERVVYALHQMFPEAPIYTSYATDEWRAKLDNKVVTGYLQHWPFSKLRKFVGILRIRWFRRLDFTDYDVVISSTGNGEAKGIRVPLGTTHICYCHSPVHYYWRHYDQYMARPGFGVFDPLVRLGLRLLVGPLRRWDHRAAQRPDLFIANSMHIQKDIKRFYGRDAVVIHPPVDVERFAAAERPKPGDGAKAIKRTGAGAKQPPGPEQKRQGFVTVSRLTPAKRVDIAVEACTRLNVPLTVIGDGPDYEHLRRLAGPSITFLAKAAGNRASDEEVARRLASAEAFLFASFDDFGIVGVEAQAAGTPVIAFKAGGAVDYIEPNKTGLFFNEQTVDSLCAALEAFQKISQTLDPAYIRSRATRFSTTAFQQHLHDLVANVTNPAKGSS